MAARSRIVSATSELIDEASVPSVRQVLGDLMARSTMAEFAVAKLRLAGLDLGAAELGNLQSCRLLLGRLDADTLADVPGGPASSHLTALRRFLDSGHVEIRAAGAGAWSPDFSILQTTDGDRLLVGGHYFGRPEPAGGTVFTCILTSPMAVRRARQRFAHLWDAGYDVLPVIRGALDDAARPG